MNLELIAKKLSAMAKATKADKGPLELLGLFLRDESQELWDLVIAAPWLKADERASFEYIVRQLRKVMADGELAGLSRIVILDHGGAVLKSFLDRFKGHAGLADVHFVTEGGAVIRKAYVVVARPVPAGNRGKTKKPHRRTRL